MQCDNSWDSQQNVTMTFVSEGMTMMTASLCDWCVSNRLSKRCSAIFNETLRWILHDEDLQLLKDLNLLLAWRSCIKDPYFQQLLTVKYLRPGKAFWRHHCWSSADGTQSKVVQDHFQADQWTVEPTCLWVLQALKLAIPQNYRHQPSEASEVFAFDTECALCERKS